MSRSRTLARWMPVAVLALLPVLHAVVAGAAPAEAPMLGFTPTVTVTTPCVGCCPYGSKDCPTPCPTCTPDDGTDSFCDPIITKRCDPAVAKPGEEVTCVIVVNNEGDEKAEDVQIIDQMSDYLDILDVVVDPQDQGQERMPRDGQQIVVDAGTVGRWDREGQPFEVKVVIRARVQEDAPASVCVENVAELKALNCPDRMAEVFCTQLPETGGSSLWWTMAGGVGTVLLVLSLVLATRDRS